MLKHKLLITFLKIFWRNIQEIKIRFLNKKLLFHVYLKLFNQNVISLSVMCNEKNV